MVNSNNNNQQLHAKLNPIYAAIDAYQFNRAIKLASSLPDSNVLGKALLAHSYTKAGQKHQALVTLHRILIGQESSSSSIFFELQSVLNQQNALASSSASALSAAPSKAELPSGKKGKKGKKKPTPKVQQQRTVGEIQPRADLIDRLDVPPLIPETIDFLPTADGDSSQSTIYANVNIITDETTLATLAVSLKTLNLPQTVYQMYARAADTLSTELMLTKTFTSGLSVLAAPSTWDAESQSRVETHVLGHMQTVSLQLVRVAVSANNDSTLMLATAWACQSALWQLEWLPEDDKRSLILPRLAESMARKLLQQEKDRNQFSKEIRLLCIRILERQSKWDEIFQILEDIIPIKKDDDTCDTAAGDLASMATPPSEFGVTMTHHQIKLETAKVMKKMHRYDDAQIIYERLLQNSPDDWSCWKAHLECSIAGRNNNDVGPTQALVDRFIKEREGSRNQLRGPHLMMVEIAAEELRKDFTDGNLRALESAIQQYAKTFANRANCTITDLDHYLTILSSHQNSGIGIGDDNCIGRNVTISLLQFAESLRKSNASDVAASDSRFKKEHLSNLRAYIFAVKLTHKILSTNNDLADKYLPDWIEIVREWKATFSLNDGVEVCSNVYCLRSVAFRS
jgi:tetratricopeptide (TPR) repeat protein